MASPDPSNTEPQADSKETDRRQSTPGPVADDTAEAEQTIDFVQEMDPSATVAYQSPAPGNDHAVTEAVVPSVDDCVRGAVALASGGGIEIGSVGHSWRQCATGVALSVEPAEGGYFATCKPDARIVANE